jgi:hypothetical protein
MSSNVSVVNLEDGRQVLLSYGVPVAAFIPGRGYVRTSERFSVTTSRHASTFAGRDSVQVPPAEFAILVSPITGGR